VKGLKYIALCICFLAAFPLFSQVTYLELNLNESRRSNPFSKQRSALGVFNVIEKAANDSKINGIVLNIASISSNREYLWELRTALEQFKARGKKIVAYIYNADMDIYCLASVADKILMDELGSLYMMGYSMGRGYMLHMLEKLGVGVRELRFFEYKTAAETFSRDSMSQADRRQYGEYLDDIFNLTRDTLKSARGWTDEEFNTILNNDFMYSSKGASIISRLYPLVDQIGTDVLYAINSLYSIEEKAPVNFVLYGDSESSITGTSRRYSPAGTGGNFLSRLWKSSPAEIAVVYANGETEMDRGMEIAKLSRTIRTLADNILVKAIVIRMDSPGGSASAADYFAEAVRYAKSKKPVVVSMGSLAASGGYWASMNANHIMATPYTITGSIGVIGNWFYDNGLNNKIGFNIDILQRGAHADLFSGFLIPYRNMTEQEEGRFKTYMTDIYDTFVYKVSQSRGMKKEEVEAVAQGRIFSGTRAFEAGLIDSVGGLPDALRVARELAGIKEGKAVKYDEYPKPTFMESLINRFPVLAKLPWFAGFAENGKGGMAGTIEDIRYRIENNGEVMPILPLEWVLK
jgi:protease-4